jgi:3-oxo-5-alpha-steroid 4-dehydrogenase 1
MSLEKAYCATLIAILVLALITIIASRLGQGGYGRHLPSRASPRATMPAKAAWLLFECPQLFAFALSYWLLADAHSGASLLLFAVWQAHYCYRGLIYPLRRRDAGQRFPLANVGMGFFFNALNGFANAYAVSHAPHLQNWAWLQQPWFVAGALIAVCGWLTNFQADNILLRLRGGKQDGTAAHQSRYRIPYGGAFRWVSSANYFGEIVWWLGWALMSNTAAAWVFWAFTLSNLVPRALDNHRWYLQKFSDYPKGRKAVFPFVL